VNGPDVQRAIRNTLTTLCPYQPHSVPTGAVVEHLGSYGIDVTRTQVAIARVRLLADRGQTGGTR
jgi:hypothetical protein